MKITLTTTLAGPHGTAKPGTVLDLPQAVADEFLRKRSARVYDNSRDKDAPRGLTKQELVKA